MSDHDRWTGRRSRRGRSGRSSSSLVVLTGRNRRRGTWIARDPSKTSIGGAHGGLDLDDRGRVLAARVDGLAVDDDRQPEPARRGRGSARAARQGVEVDPEVVGVEQRVPLGVLEELLLVLRRHHRAVAQHQPAVAPAHGEVAALAVVDGPLADLGDVGDSSRPSTPAIRRVAGGAEVVGVGEERVAKTLVHAAPAAARWRPARRRRRRGPGGHHSRSGSSGHATGARSSARSLGSAFWRKSSGSPSTGEVVVAASTSSDWSRVRNEFIRMSGTCTPYCSRSASTCRATTSRKVRPSRTSSTDFGPESPMHVPSPPLSLTTAVARAPRPSRHRSARSPPAAARRSAARCRLRDRRTGGDDVLELGVARPRRRGPPLALPRAAPCARRASASPALLIRPAYDGRCDRRRASTKTALRQRLRELRRERVRAATEAEAGALAARSPPSVERRTQGRVAGSPPTSRSPPSRHPPAAIDAARRPRVTGHGAGDAGGLGPGLARRGTHDEALGREAIRDAEVVVAPAHAVDRSGNRLGQGRGCYDRALARRTRTRSSSSCSTRELLDEGFPRTPHDAPCTSRSSPSDGDGPALTLSLRSPCGLRVSSSSRGLLAPPSRLNGQSKSSFLAQASIWSL